MSSSDRRHVRRRVRVSVRARDAGSPTQGEILFDAVDLSQGGAFLESELLLEVGDELEIAFAIPGELRPMRVRAKVAWATRSPSAHHNAGMGLEFLDLKEPDRDRLAMFVRALKQG